MPAVTLENLKTMYLGDTGAVAEMVTVFLRHVPKMIADCTSAFGDSDGARIKASVHSLKGAVLIFGDSRLCEELKKVDRDCIDGRYLEAKAAFPALLDETLRFCKRLEEIKRQCEGAT